MNTSVQRRLLKIGYVMQADSVQMDEVSGPQVHVMAVVRGLEKRGHQVRMVAIQKGVTQWTDDLIHWLPAAYQFSQSPWFRLGESPLRVMQTLLRLPFLRFFDSYRFSDTCVSALAGFDILYERYGLLSYGGLIAARRLGIPIALEVNGDLVEEYHQLGIRLSKAQWAAIHIVTRRMFREADHIVAVGQTIKERIVCRWHCDPAKIGVVTNGVDVDSFHKPSASGGVRSVLLKDDGAVVIFVGSFEPWHGVQLLLEGFRHVASAHATARLLLVGDGRLRLEMENWAAALGLGERVVFTGRVAHEEVAALLSVSDVAVICHTAAAAEIVETPLKLFEYMAAGKAIVAPKVLNMERVLTDRVTGLLVPPDDAEALAAAVNELLDDGQLRACLGDAARQEAVAKHSWARVADQLESAFFQLLDRGQT